jgi:cation transport ATPase
LNFSKTKEELIILAKSLSKLSHHPLSKSIAKYDDNVKSIEVEKFEEIKGK